MSLRSSTLDAVVQYLELFNVKVVGKKLLTNRHLPLLRLLAVAVPELYCEVTCSEVLTVAPVLPVSEHEPELCMYLRSPLLPMLHICLHTCHSRDPARTSISLATSGRGLRDVISIADMLLCYYVLSRKANVHETVLPRDSTDLDALQLLLLPLPIEREYLQKIWEKLCRLEEVQVVKKLLKIAQILEKAATLCGLHVQCFTKCQYLQKGKTDVIILHSINFEILNRFLSVLQHKVEHPVKVVVDKTWLFIVPKEGNIRAIDAISRNALSEMGTGWSPELSFATFTYDADRIDKMLSLNVLPILLYREYDSFRLYVSAIASRLTVLSKMVIHRVPELKLETIPELGHEERKFFLAIRDIFYMS